MKARSKKKARPAARAMAGLQEALAFAKGEATGVILHVPDTLNVKAIREAQGLTQDLFAARYGFALSALREWEQGRRMPDRAARLFLKVIAREPKAVQRALAAE